MTRAIAVGGYITLEGLGGVSIRKEDGSTRVLLVPKSIPTVRAMWESHPMGIRFVPDHSGMLLVNGEPERWFSLSHRSKRKRTVTFENIYTERPT